MPEVSVIGWFSCAVLDATLQTLLTPAVWQEVSRSSLRARNKMRCCLFQAAASTNAAHATTPQSFGTRPPADALQLLALHRPSLCNSPAMMMSTQR